MSSAGSRPQFCHPVFELTDVNVGYFMNYISNILGGSIWHTGGLSDRTGTEFPCSLQTLLLPPHPPSLELQNTTFVVTFCFTGRINRTGHQSTAIDLCLKNCMINILKSTKKHLSSSLIFKFVPYFEIHVHKHTHACVWIVNQSNYLGSRFWVLNILWASKKCVYPKYLSGINVKFSRLKWLKDPACRSSLIH